MCRVKSLALVKNRSEVVLYSKKILNFAVANGIKYHSGRSAGR